MRPRLLAIAKMIKKNDQVLDVGTDHGYLPIYLSEHKIGKKILASDISKNALNSAKENIKKKKINNIKLYLSDGLKSIDESYDTLIISGLGTNSIIRILNSGVIPKQIILSSNTNQYQLRKYMNKIGYTLKKNKAVKDKEKYYVINYYIKGQEKLSKNELKYGKALSKNYYKYLYDKNKNLLKEVNMKTKIKFLVEMHKLKKLFT